jgi:hypothetical protein
MKIFIIIFVSVFLIANYSSFAQNENSAQQNEVAGGPWGVMRQGVKTRVSCLDNDLMIGKPVRLKLELMNAGDTTIEYHSLTMNDPMRIIDPNGNEVPCIVRATQWVTSNLPLRPNEVGILLSNFDANTEYVLAKSGKYTIQFRGEPRGDFLQIFKDFPLPESNTLTVELKPGEPSPQTKLAKKLLAIVPGGWRLERVWAHSLPRSDGSQLFAIGAEMMRIERPETKQQGSPQVNLLLLEERREGLDTKFVASHLDNSEYLGKSSLGYVYLSSYEADALWPNAKDQVRQALGIVDENK